jgi:hypothetical protein
MKSFALASITALAVATIPTGDWYGYIGQIYTDEIYMTGFVQEAMINDGSK